ncbi:HEPN domain-containing protein [Flavobacterium lacustre]|uniref:HEPN domain-containing protein n=1 Tax=Flavobacterium lacustre TaxID=3016339 RepID=UPI0022B688B1|nr:HEPN domain-containing protein [Flavobacterium lacustre]
MKDYYCLNLKFKDKKISDKIFHSHLFVNDKEMYFQIIDNDTTSRIDSYFSISENALGLFEENFEVIDTEISIIFDQSRIFKVVSFQNDDKNQYFTIYVSKICLIHKNLHNEFVNEGVAYLNNNGLSVTNLFYSFFTNFKNKNTFSISRMNGMHDFYKIDNIKFRPELEFKNNEKRGSKKLTIKKIPTIKFNFEEIEFEEIKNRIQLICNFLSFCFSVRIIVEKIVFRTEDEIFIFRDTEPNNKTYISELTNNFRFLKENFTIDKILKTDWFSNYKTNEISLTKAIDNFLHAREVSLGASFLLLFNIIEIFNINKNQEKFNFNISKDEMTKEIVSHFKQYLTDKNDEIEFEKKLEGVFNKIEYKPFKSPLEETLKTNNIDPTKFGFTLNKLKRTRDSITHGSLSSIKEEDLKLQIYCIRKIAICLILSKFGLKDDLHKNVT